MAGEYRALLRGTEFEHVRLARTDCPMYGVTRRPDLKEPLIALFSTMDNDIARKKLQQLRNGEAMPITEDFPNNSDNGTGRYANRAEKNWAPGELFFRS